MLQNNDKRDEKGYGNKMNLKFTVSSEEAFSLTKITSTNVGEAIKNYLYSRERLLWYITRIRPSIVLKRSGLSSLAHASYT